MAHRGRLNVLANIVGKSYNQIFREFEGNIDPRTVQGSGDVKYHLGAEGEFVAGTGDKIKVSIAANPSHLETVDPVLEGIARAKQDVLNQGAAYPVLPLLIHGDAAFAGQGVVAETLNLSQLRGYRTGGTIHVVVNNQVGFTTSPASSRSSLYCTDVARMVQAPIFHVNGDDPEACIRVARLAFEYRQAFNKDVVIDLVCYRRRGHNEGDDPSYTQPLMYDLIEQKRSVRKLYTESLIGRGDITLEEAEQVLQDYQQQLERVFTEVREADTRPDEWTTVPAYPEKVGRHHHHRDLRGGDQADRRRPRLPARGLHRAPEGAPAAAAAGGGDRRGPDRLGHRRDPRVRLAADGGPPGPAGRPGLPPRHVRAAVRDDHRPQERQRVDPAGEPHRGPGAVPRLRLAARRSTPRSASSTATRWPGPTRWCCGRRSSATSSTAPRSSPTSTSPPARPSGASSPASCCCCRTATRARARTTPRPGSSGSSRWRADDAFVVAQPSTPASHFHLLRRHALGEEHKPLIVFTPKSMLKRKEAASQPEAFTHGSFAPVIGDSAVDPDKVSTRAAVQRPDHLGPHGRARQAAGRRPDHRDRADRAAVPAAGRGAPRRARAGSRTCARCAGCRTSRRTWARRRTSS